MRVLIVGIDCAIGRQLGEMLAARGDTVIGTTRRADRSVPGQVLLLDLAAKGSEEAELPAVDCAVFCAAMARFAECRDQPAIAERVNVTVPAALASRLVRQGARAVMLSTSAVLDCRVPHMAADRPTAPSSAYGRLKAAAEAAFAVLGPAAPVLRLTKVLTPNMPLINGWIDALRARRPIQAFSDLRIAPLMLDDVVDALLTVLGDHGGGIYQVSGARDVSYAEVALHLATRLGVETALVTAENATVRGVPAEEVTAYTSLDVGRLVAMKGFVPPDPFAVIDRVFHTRLAASTACPA